jgi:hypothetical protein
MQILQKPAGTLAATRGAVHQAAEITPANLIRVMPAKGGRRST